MKRFFIISLFAILSILFFTINSYAQGYSYEQEEIIVPEYEVTIYPNPITENKFFVKSETTVKSVEVLNVIGQNIAKVENNTGVPYNILVNLPDCEKGMYMVRITFENSAKIIKKVLVK